MDEINIFLEKFKIEEVRSHLVRYHYNTHSDYIHAAKECNQGCRIWSGKDFINVPLEKDSVAITTSFERVHKNVLKNTIDVFKLADKDGDGMLNESEIERIYYGKLSINQRKRLALVIKKTLDENNSVQVSIEKFAKAIMQTSRRSSNPEISEVFKALDVDGSGKIGAAELLQAVNVDQKRVFTRNEVETLIQDFDKNKDGKINEQEFENIIKSCMQRDQDESMTDYD